jgi:hypothetical protein
MTIYLTNIILVAVFGICSYSYAQCENKNIFGEYYINPSKVFNLLMLTTLILTYALRWRTGTDTPGYISTYYNMGDYSLTDILAWDDRGFYVIDWIDYRLFHGSLLLHNIILGVITYCPIFELYKKYSGDYPKASILVILTTCYYFSFNGQRQGLAIGICIIAYLFLCQKKYIFTIILVYIATEVHSVAFVMYLIFFIAHRKTKSKIFIVATVLMLFSAIFMSNLWEMMFEFLGIIGRDTLVERYATQASFYSGSNILRFMVVCVPTVLGIWKYSELSTMYVDYDEVLNLNIITCVFFLAGTYSWLLARISQFTLPFLPILLIKESQIFTQVSRRIYYFVVFVLFFIYMVVYIHLDSNLLPYYFMDSEHLFY